MRNFNEKKFRRKINSNNKILLSLFLSFSLLIFVESTSIIDYSYSIINDETPNFAIKIKDDNNQSTKYYGLFYKAWKCDNGSDEIKYGSFNSDIKTCEILPTFDENDVFINPNGVKITKEQYNIIKNYYFDNYANFKSEQEVEIAYKISSEINKVWWVSKVEDLLINNDSSIKLAVFGEVENVDGYNELLIQYNNSKYYKCYKKINDTNVFSEYNYLDNTCGSSWETLSLDKKTCELAKNSTEFVKNYVRVTKLCE